DDPVVASELGWRIFVPFSVVAALILAIALSEVSPRQGRYLKLFPALLIFASLIVAMMAVKTRVSKAELGIWHILWYCSCMALLEPCSPENRSLRLKSRNEFSR